MKRIITISFFITLFISCGNDNETATLTETIVVKNEAFEAMLEDYYQESLKIYPLNATNLGDNRYNDLLPNILSDEFKADEKALFTKYKDLLSQYKDEDLTEDQQLSKAILNWDCDINLNRMTFREDLLPINQFSTLQNSFGQLASGAGAQPFKTVEDYNNWLKRVDGYIVWMNSAQERMEEGITLKTVLPKTLIVKAIDQFKVLSEGKVEDHLFFQPIKTLPADISEADAKILTETYTAMVKDRVIPAYKKMHQFMSASYLDAGRPSSGIAEVPNGKTYYNHLIKLYTTTSMNADEIHQLGLSEVERITAEMEKVKEQVGFEGDLKAFFDHVRTSKELMPFTEPDQVLAHFNEIHETMKPQIERLFDLKPKAAFEIRRTETFREASASAEYNPGSQDGTRPGIFYTPIPDATKYNVLSDEALFLHEAIPGHHYQFSLQQENDKLPNFRKILWYSSYGEGWALYTESLGKELGLYTDPYQYFGMLSMEMHRAIRLVVDPGMHVMGWSREKAIQYSLDHEAESEASITSEIERYMAIPGQALSYKIGQLKIRALRATAEKTLGDKFNIAEFHNEILNGGCIPLNLLEAKINAWMESEK
ncbi:MAG: DUF885 domain-containing protein [Flavobacteriales bacterium]|nr:MAG: DUF885 domain-containing protein [Flavobacteriales bacterium]